MKDSSSTPREKMPPRLPLHILKLPKFSLEILNQILECDNPKHRNQLLQELYETQNNNRRLKSDESDLFNLTPPDVNRNLTEQGKKIENQFSDIEEIWRELIANSIDALNRNRPIGQFGMGGSLGALSLLASDEKSENTQEKRKARLVAINNTNGSLNGLIISPQGKTYTMDFNQENLQEYDNNYPNNSTVIAIYPGSKFLPVLQNIHQKYANLKDQEFENCEIPELETFRFLDSAVLKLEIYDENGNLKNSKITNQDSLKNSQIDNPTAKIVTLRVFEDHFEVINPSNKELHPVTFYENKSTKNRKKEIVYNLETIKESTPSIYILGEGNLVVEKLPLPETSQGIPLIPDSLTSLKLRIPLSLDMSRGEARLNSNFSLEEWKNMILDLKESLPISEFIKVLNSLNLYIKNLPVGDPKRGILQTNYLKVVKNTAKDSLEKIKTENPEIAILPNLKGFERVNIENKEQAIFVDTDFLESYQPEKILDAISLNPDIFTKTPAIKLVGVDFEFQERVTWQDFLKTARKTQEMGRDFIYSSQLPFLGMPDPNSVRDFTQIWLPKDWLEKVQEKFNKLKRLYEYLVVKEFRQETKDGLEERQENESEDLEEDLANLENLEQEYDEIISVLQIICSPKTDYETNFIPPIDFKLSGQIRKEVETKTNKALAKLEQGKNEENLDDDLDEEENPIEQFKQGVLTEVLEGKDEKIKNIAEKILNLVFKEAFERGLGNVEEISIETDNRTMLVNFSRLALNPYLPNLLELTNNNEDNDDIFSISTAKDHYYYYLNVPKHNCVLNWSFVFDINFSFHNKFKLAIEKIENIIVKKAKEYYTKIRSNFEARIEDWTSSDEYATFFSKFKKEYYNQLPRNEKELFLILVQKEENIEYNEFLQAFQKYNPETAEEIKLLIQDLKRELQKLESFLNDIQTLQKPTVSEVRQQIQAKTNKNPTEQEFCSRDLSNYQTEYIGDLTNEQGEKLEVWTFLDGESYMHSDPYSFIVLKNIVTGEFEMIDYRLCFRFGYNSNHVLRNLKEQLSIMNGSLFLDRESFYDRKRDYDLVTENKHIYLYQPNKGEPISPEKQRFNQLFDSMGLYMDVESMLTVGSDSDRYNVMALVESGSDQIIKSIPVNKNFCHEIEDANPSFDIVATTESGYYLLDGYGDNYRISFLSAKELLDYPEGSGQSITPITVFEIPKNQVVEDGFPVFSDNPHFVLNNPNNSQNTTTILPLKKVIKDFDKNYTKSLEAKEIQEQIPEYVEKNLKPNLESFNNFIESLNLEPEDKTLFLNFCQKGLLDATFHNLENFEIEPAILQKYFDLIGELKDGFLACFRNIQNSPLYQEDNGIYRNFNLLESLFFKPEMIPNFIQILESYKEIKSDPNLKTLASKEEIFNIIYESFLIAGDESPSILTNPLDGYNAEHFTTENLKNYLYIILSFADEINELSSSVRCKYNNFYELIKSPSISNKIVNLLLAKKNTLNPTDLENVWSALQKICDFGNPNFTPTAKIYYDYFTSKEKDDFVTFVKEEELLQEKKLERLKNGKDLKDLKTQLASLLAEKQRQQKSFEISDPQKEKLTQNQIPKAERMIQEALETSKIQQQEAVEVVLRELLQNALDITSNQPEAKIEINRDITTGSGNYLEKDQNYFHFSVKDNGAGADILRLLSSFDSTKDRQSQQKQQGYFGAGFKTIFGIENGISCIETCRQLDSEVKLWTRIWLEREEEGLRMLDFEEKEVGIETETFTKIDVYKPIKDDFPIGEVLSFDSYLARSTSLLDLSNDSKLEISRNQKKLENPKLKPYSEDKITVGKYDLNIKTYPNETKLDPMLYIDNLPVMDISKLLAKYNLPTWMLQMCQNSSVQFSFRTENNENHPLNITRNDFSDFKVEQAIVAKFLAQVLSYFSKQVIEQNWNKILNDEILQNVEGNYGVSKIQMDADIVKLSDFLNQSLDKDIEGEAFSTEEFLETLQNLKSKENPGKQATEKSKKLRDQLLKLVRFSISVTDIPEKLKFMSILEIRQEYQRILKKDAEKEEFEKWETDFMQWIQNTQYGKNSKLTRSITTANQYIHDSYTREYRVFEPKQIPEEERLVLNQFEEVCNKMLNDFNQSISKNTNFQVFEQEFYYTESDKNRVAANWKVEKLGNKIKIIWYWDKANILNKMKDLKEAIYLFLHEFCHNIEDILKGVSVGSEDTKNPVESHGPEFVALLRVITLQSIGGNFRR